MRVWRRAILKPVLSFARVTITSIPVRPMADPYNIGDLLSFGTELFDGRVGNHWANEAGEDTRQPGLWSSLLPTYQYIHIHTIMRSYASLPGQ